MPLRPPAGFIRPGFDPLKNPDAPTIGAATKGDSLAVVSFTPPTNVGGSAISAYYAVSNPSQVTVSGTTSPITVTGLTNGTAYTFNVWALNTYGPGVWSAASGSVTPAPLQRGLFASGYNQGYTYAISYIDISTLGNGLAFGDLYGTQQAQGGGFASSTRAVFAGGTGTGGNRTTAIRYVTIATVGNANDFGNLLQDTGEIGGGASNETRGMIFGGYNPPFSNVIQYVTIATTGNALNFGSLNQAKSNTAALSSPTIAVMAGGYAGDPGNPFSYIGKVTIATTGNTTTFGNLFFPTLTFTGCSNNTRGIFAGGGSSGGVTNVIQYITIATSGDSIYFGDLTALRGNLSSVSSPTRAVFSYGENGALILSSLDYVTIATTGNSAAFGALNNAFAARMSTSNCHGGL